MIYDSPLLKFARQAALEKAEAAKRQRRRVTLPLGMFYDPATCKLYREGDPIELVHGNRKRR